jgi:hypothetical protein
MGFIEINYSSVTEFEMWSLNRGECDGLDLESLHSIKLQKPYTD